MATVETIDDVAVAAAVVVVVEQQQPMIEADEPVFAVVVVDEPMIVTETNAIVAAAAEPVAMMVNVLAAAEKVDTLNVAEMMIAASEAAALANLVVAITTTTTTTNSNSSSSSSSSSSSRAPAKSSLFKPIDSDDDAAASTRKTVTWATEQLSVVKESLKKISRDEIDLKRDILVTDGLLAISTARAILLQGISGADATTTTTELEAEKRNCIELYLKASTDRADLNALQKKRIDEEATRLSVLSDMAIERDVRVKAHREWLQEIDRLLPTTTTATAMNNNKKRQSGDDEDSTDDDGGGGRGVQQPKKKKKKQQQKEVVATVVDKSKPSKYVGVERRPDGRFRARLSIGKERRISLGCFVEEKAAAIAFDHAKIIVFGSGAVKSKLNFPDSFDEYLKDRDVLKRSNSLNMYLEEEQEKKKKSVAVTTTANSQVVEVDDSAEEE